MFDQTIKQLNRLQTYQIWLKAKAGEPQEDEEDERFAKAMLEHSEYHSIWDRLDHIKDSEVVQNGVHSLLHISMHTVIENQLAQNTPPEIQKALDALLKRGASRHEAIHAIAYEFTMELHKTLQTGRPFDNLAYKRRLEKLSRRKRY